MDKYLDLESLIKKDNPELKPIYQLQYLEKIKGEQKFILKNMGMKRTGAITHITNFKFMTYDCDVVSYILQSELEDVKKPVKLKMIGIHFSLENNIMFALDIVLNCTIVDLETAITGDLQTILTYKQDGVTMEKIIETNMEYPGNDKIIYTLITRLHDEKITSQLKIC
jgi:hypothetical protein